MPKSNIFQEHIWPFIGDLVDLGSSVLRWRSIWPGDFNASGTATVTRTPTATTDIANKAYVDAQALGISPITIREVDGAPTEDATIL